MDKYKPNHQPYSYMGHSRNMHDMMKHIKEFDLVFPNSDGSILEEKSVWTYGFFASGEIYSPRAFLNLAYKDIYTASTVLDTHFVHLAKEHGGGGNSLNFVRIQTNKGIVNICIKKDNFKAVKKYIRDKLTGSGVV